MEFLQLLQSVRMPRKRYSEGSLDKVGKRHKNWRGCWFVYETVDGREVRRKREKIIGPATMPKHEARAHLIRLIAESRGELPPPPDNPTITELWGRYQQHKSGAWSKSTSNTLVSLFKTQVLPYLGNCPVIEVTLGPLQEILNRMAASGRSKSSLEKARVHLKAMLEFAVDERMLNVNPARGKKLTIPKKGVPKADNRYFSLPEVRALMGKAQGREHLIVRLLLVAGLRSQELFLLRANDVQPGAIRVDEAFKRSESGDARIGDTKTQQSADVVPIPAALEKELRDWIRSQRVAPDGLLFPNSHGGLLDPHNYLERVLKPLAISAGINDMTYHAMRRTCATYFRGDIKGAQRQLRHASPQVTAANYQQVITEEHRAAVERMDREFQPRKVVPIKKRA